MNELYPYASGDLIEHPNSYFYTPYHGSAFIEAWQVGRRAVRRTLPDAIAPPAAKAVDETSNLSADLLERALAGDERLREAFIKKFEITKRIHERYDESFKAIDKIKRHNLALYIRAADLFEASFGTTRSARHLNVYLKCLDTLCAHAAGLSNDLAARLAWHISREREHFETMAEKIGGAA